MKIPVLLAVFAFMLFGCATRSTVPDTDAGSKIGDAVTAPLQDLNLIRTKIPPVLIKAKEDPYQRPADIICEATKTEVTELDAALGPDMDARRSSSDQGMLRKGGAMAEESAIDALRGTTRGVIPFNGWVRKLSGAERHSKEVANAIASGIVRRAYLKGLGESHGCEAPAAPLPPPPVADPAQPATRSNGDAQPVEMSD
jgi:hypothetical protein